MCKLFACLCCWICVKDERDFDDASSESSGVYYGFNVDYNSESESSFEPENEIIQQLRKYQFLPPGDPNNYIEAYIYPISHEKAEFQQFAQRVQKHKTVSLADIALLGYGGLDKLQANRGIDTWFSNGYGFAVVQIQENPSIVCIHARENQLRWVNWNGEPVDLIGEANLVEYNYVYGDFDETEDDDPPHDEGDPMILWLRESQYLGRLSDFWLTDEKPADLPSYIYPICYERDKFQEFMGKIRAYKSVSLLDIASAQGISFDKLQSSKKIDTSFKRGYGFVLAQHNGASFIVPVCAIDNEIGWANLDGEMIDEMDEFNCIPYISSDKLL